MSSPRFSPVRTFLIKGFQGSVVLYAGIGQERRIAVHGYIDKAYGQVVVESTEQVFYFSGFGNGEIVAELLILLQHIVELFSIDTYAE